MSFPRYPKYKASGVEWLGDVPAHWRVDRLKRSVLSARNGVWGDEPRGDSDDIPCVRVADFDRVRLLVCLVDPTIRSVGTSDRLGRVLSRGDLLLEKSGGGESQPVGCVVLYDDSRPAVCSNFVARVQISQGMDSAFWRYAHAAAYAAGINRKSIKQTSGLQNLDSQQYFDEAAPFPPLDEQSGIAEFLDRETAKIDALVAEQQRLIELLKEKRQAVISHAVTKGLDPNAKMKPSGIEWLGDVPAHWRVGKCGFYMKVLAGYAFPSQGFSDQPEHVRLLRGVNVGVGALRWDDVVYWRREPGDELEEYELREGQIVIGMDRPLIGDGVRVARVQATDLPCMLLQRVASLTAGDALNADYFVSLLASSMFVAHFLPQTTGVSVPHISPQQIMDFVIPVPPMDEQSQIVMRLEALGRESQVLIAEAERAITLLQERRTALISAAVTGQIDVTRLAKATA